MYICHIEKCDATPTPTHTRMFRLRDITSVTYCIERQIHLCLLTVSV